MAAITIASMMTTGRDRLDLQLIVKSQQEAGLEAQPARGVMGAATKGH